MEQYYRRLTVRKGGFLALWIIIGIIILIFLFRSIKIVQPGYVGVRVLFGKVVEPTLKSGFHIINPFTALFRMSTRTQAYTMSGTAREGKVRGDDAIEALTKEGLRVKLDLTIWYKIDPVKAGEIYGVPR